jgi:hypothetical protein
MFVNSWQAIAVARDGQQHLLVLGNSLADLRSSYSTCFKNILRPEEAGRIVRIEARKWSGPSDRGNWEPKEILPLPTLASVA